MLHKFGLGMPVVLMLGLGTLPANAANREQLQTTWEGLSVMVGHDVRIVMPDGARIAGKATAVEVDALAIEIGKTSNPVSYPKGRFLVPRATLKAVDVSRPTRKWRIVGLSVGGGIGAFLGVVAIELDSSGFQTRHPVKTGLTIGAVGATVVGYLLGWAADRRTITYVIKP